MKYKMTDPRAILPNRANPLDAGLDLFALEDVTIHPGEIKKIRTGIHVAMKDGETGLYWEKSGRALAGLQVLGGCIDGPYRGELFVTVTNCNLATLLEFMLTKRRELFDKLPESTIHIPYGKAITQFIHLKGVLFEDMELLSPDEFDTLTTIRGEKGFGSSDKPERGPIFPGMKFDGENWILAGGFRIAPEQLKQLERQIRINPDRIDSIREDFLRQLVKEQTSPEFFTEAFVNKIIGGYEPIFQACTIISGPHTGAIQRIVPKESWYFRGSRHSRIPGTNNYRLTS